MAEYQVIKINNRRCIPKKFEGNSLADIEEFLLSIDNNENNSYRIRRGKNYYTNFKVQGNQVYNYKTSKRSQSIKEIQLVNSNPVNPKRIMSDDIDLASLHLRIADLEKKYELLSEKYDLIKNNPKSDSMEEIDKIIAYKELFEGDSKGNNNDTMMQMVGAILPVLLNQNKKKVVDSEKSE